MNKRQKTLTRIRELCDQTRAVKKKDRDLAEEYNTSGHHGHLSWVEVILERIDKNAMEINILLEEILATINTHNESLPEMTEEELDEDWIEDVSPWVLDNKYLLEYCMEEEGERIIVWDLISLSSNKKESDPV